MQFTIEVPDSIGKAITDSPDSRQLVIDALKGVAEQLQGEKNTQEGTQPSKWEKLVEINKKDPIRLSDYTDQDRKERAEFRRDFEFHHDQ